MTANNLTGTDATGEWISAEPFQAKISLDGDVANVTDLSQGTNLIVWKVTKGGCEKSDSITIISHKVTTSISGVDDNNQIYTCDDHYRLSAVLPRLPPNSVWRLTR